MSDDLFACVRCGAPEDQHVHVTGTRSGEPFPVLLCPTATYKPPIVKSGEPSRPSQVKDREP